MHYLSQKAYYVQARPQHHARETSGIINFVIMMLVFLIFLTIGGAFAKTMFDDIIQKANAGLASPHGDHNKLDLVMTGP